MAVPSAGLCEEQRRGLVRSRLLVCLRSRGEGLWRSRLLVCVRFEEQRRGLVVVPSAGLCEV